MNTYRTLALEPLEQRQLLTTGWLEPPAPLNINADTDTGNDNSPQVATDGAGTWVATWSSNDRLNDTIGDDEDILISRSLNAGLTWSNPAPLNTNADTDTDNDWLPQITTDKAGTWIATWASYNDLRTEDILISRSLDAGLTWDNPTHLNTTDAGKDRYPQVTTDESGTWIATWSSRDRLNDTIGNDWDILVSRSLDAGLTWSNPAPLNTNADTDAGKDKFQQITTDGSGTWLATWTSTDNLNDTIGDDEDILISRSLNAGLTWSNPVPLNTDANTDLGNDKFPQITTDEAGTWIATWTSTNNLDGTVGDEDILISRSLDAGLTWSNPFFLNPTYDAGNDGLSQLTTNGSGAWVAVWRTDSFGDTDIYASRSDDAGLTWSNPAPLNTNADTDTGNDWNPQITTDESNNWVLAWSSRDTLNETIAKDRDVLFTTFSDTILAGTVTRDGRSILVQGTTGNDSFELTTSTTDYLHRITLNGQRHRFPTAVVDIVEFEGNSGNNQTIINGTAADETLEIGPDYLQFETSTELGNVLVTGHDVSNIKANLGAGNDTLRIEDSSGEDTLEAWPHTATFTGPGFYHEANGFESLLGYARTIPLSPSSGTDTAILHDSLDSDFFESSPDISHLTGTGFFLRVKFFEIVSARADAGGGRDRAILEGSTSAEDFYGDYQVARISTSDPADPSIREANLFDKVIASAGGGWDLAQFEDSPGDDTFLAWPDTAELDGPGFSIATFGYDETNITATNGGTADIAYLRGSDGDDLFIAEPTYAEFSGTNFTNRVELFDYVHAYSSNDPNDTSTDTAHLTGSLGPDTFVGTPTASWLSGDGYYYRAKYFEEVYSEAGGGHDEAYLYDLAQHTDALDGSSSVTTAGRWASVSGIEPGQEYLYQVANYDYAEAFASDEDDESQADPTTVDWLFQIGWD